MKIIVKVLNFTIQSLVIFELIIIFKFLFFFVYSLDEVILQEFLKEFRVPLWVSPNPIELNFL